MRERQEIFLTHETEVWPLVSLVCLFVVASFMFLTGMGWEMINQINGMLVVATIGLMPVLHVIFKDDFSR